MKKVWMIVSCILFLNAYANELNPKEEISEQRQKEIAFEQKIEATKQAFKVKMQQEERKFKEELLKELESEK